MTEFKQFKQIKTNGKINLKTYARNIVKNYREEILKARRKLGFKPRQVRLKKFIIKADEVENIEMIASSKGRSKYFWHGLIYKITEILHNNAIGYSIAGFTTDTLTKRWEHYVKNSLLKPAYREYSIHKSIYKNLENFGLDYFFKSDGRYNWKRIFALLEEKFERKVIEIHFDDLSLRQAEREYISENNLILEGLNIKSGGEGGPKIDLPIMIIANYIALGLDLNEIHQILLNKHGIKCSLSTISNRISDYWNNFEKAQIKFLKPILEELIKTGFELHEINDAFGRFMHERIKVFFGFKSYSELVKIIDKDWTNIPILKKIPKWSKQGKVKQKIPFKILKKLLIMYTSANRAVLDKNARMHLTEYNDPIAAFYYQVDQQLGYKKFKEARNAVIFPFIINQFRKDISGKDIFIKVGYKESSAKEGHNTLFRRLFHGMSTEEARNFFKDHPNIKTLNDFKKKQLTI